MSQLERQQRILALISQLEEGQSMSIKELAARFYSSESSVRRDIISLEDRGLVTHIYGGVMPARYRNSVMPASIRDSEHSEAKEKIASAAAAMISDGDTIFLDASSTASRILKYLGGKKDIRVITNNQRIFSDFGGQDFTLYCTGGTYNFKNHNFLGHMAEEYISRVSADILFFSSVGLSESGEINDISEEETAIKRAMLARARKKVFLCDSSKLGVSKLITVCGIGDVDCVISDDMQAVERIRGRASAADETI